MQPNITICSDPFSMRKESLLVPTGTTVAQILDQQNLPGFVSAGVCRNGDVVRREDYHTPLLENDFLTINIMPTGGGGSKNPIRTILTIAVVAVASVVVGPWAAGLASGAGMGATGAALVGGLAAGVATSVGMMAVNAIAPPAIPSMPSLSSTAGKNRYTYQDSPNYSIGTAKNRLTPYGPVPILLGTMRITPPYGAMPYTEQAANTQYANMLFCEGYGTINKTSLRLGETAINNFDDVDTEIKDGSNDSQVALFPRDVYMDELSIQLTKANGYQQRTTQPNTTRIILDFTWPQGIVEIRERDGKRLRHSVTIRVQTSPTGAGTWTDHGTYTKKGKETATLRRHVRIGVAKGQYDVRVKRTTADATSTLVSDASFWTGLRSIQPGSAITESGVAKTAVRIKASEQLNGTPDNFNCIAALECLDWNSGTSTWIEQETSNPASLYRYVLQGPGNLRPKTDAQVDLDGLADWHEYCDTNGFEFNHYVDYRTDVDTLLRMIASAGRARPGYVDGKHGVVVDQEQTTIVQHFTPRNTWGYRYEKLITNLPHAYRVQFRNEDEDYTEDERIVYDDGYTSANTTKFELLELPGVTSSNLAWKHARYHIAVARLRPERYTFNTSFGNLVCTAGDMVLFQNDIISVGLGTGRVKSYTTSGGNITSVTIDNEVTMVAGTDYALRVAKLDGTSVVMPIVNNPGDDNSALDVDGVLADIAANQPDVGALVLFGELDNESIELIVKDIRPIGDLNAELTCVPHAPAVHDADTGTIPAFETGITGATTLAAPVINTIRTGLDLAVLKNDSYDPRVEIVLKAPSAFSPDVIIEAHSRAQDTDDWVPSPVVDRTPTSIIIRDFVEGDYYDFRVRFNHPGDAQPSTWVQQLNTLIVGTTEKPGDVEDFVINIIGDQAYLSWAAITEIDLSYYTIRFSSQTSGVTWASSVPLVAKVSKDSVSVTVSAMVGTYSIKAVDAGGRESDDAAFIVTTVASMSAMNVVETVTEDSTFSGTKTNCEVDVSSRLIMSDPVEADDTATYGFAGSVDLSGVYTSRISADLNATGVALAADVFDRADWFEAADFFGDVAEKWDVTLYVRTTDDDPAGTPTWSSWRELIVGDYSARAFEFKAILETFEANITPAIVELSVHVDMPDRIIAEDDLTVTTGGLVVSFSPAYKSLKGLAVSGQDMATGDYYAITSKSETGFTLTFYDSTDSAVERTADYVAAGYGSVQ